jgi:hypothetical protein
MLHATCKVAGARADFATKAPSPANKRARQEGVATARGGYSFATAPLETAANLRQPSAMAEVRDLLDEKTHPSDGVASLSQPKNIGP